MSGRKRFIGNVGWLLGGKIVNMILQFLVSLATARYLGPSNFGTINYVAAFVSFFSSIASLGLSVIVIKEIASGDSDDNEVIWTSIWMRFATALLATISIISLMFITHPGNKEILIISVLESLSIIFSAFDTINYYFQAKLLSKWTAIAGVFAYLGMSLFRVVLLANNANIIWFALSTSVDMIFLAIILMIFYVKINGFKPCFNWRLGKKLIKSSYYYLIAGLITILYSQVDKVMIGSMMNNESVGLYSAALTISTLWSMIPSALIQSLVPILYEAAVRDRKLYLRRLRQSYAIIFWLNACYAIFVTIFAKWIILLLYGEAYMGATNTLIIVVWYYGISTMSTLNQVYLANDNKNRYINRFCLAGLLVNIMLNLAIIPTLGIAGAAIATLITHLTMQIIMPFFYRDTREISIEILKGAILRDVVNKEEMQLIRKEVRILLSKFKTE